MSVLLYCPIHDEVTGAHVHGCSSLRAFTSRAAMRCGRTETGITGGGSHSAASLAKTVLQSGSKEQRDEGGIASEEEGSTFIARPRRTASRQRFACLAEFLCVPRIATSAPLDNRSPVPPGRIISLAGIIYRPRGALGVKRHYTESSLKFYHSAGHNPQMGAWFFIKSVIDLIPSLFHVPDR